MTRRPRESRGPEESSGRNSGPANPGLPGYILLLAMGVVIALTVTNYMALNDLRKSLDTRLVQMDQKLAQVATKIDNAAASAQRRSGPDPARVYTVKTEEAPAKGPASAPVTIAEFSDFQ